MFDALALPGRPSVRRGDSPNPTFQGSRPARGFLARVVVALMEARQRQADRHIAQYIERHGGRITDAVERDIQTLVVPSRGL